MNIVVLAGGLSSERDVSFVTGDTVTKALRRCGHNVLMLDVFFGFGEEGDDLSDVFAKTEELSVEVKGIADEAPDIAAIKASRPDKSDCFFGPNIINVCRAADIVFIALHGSDGENGKVQATFDLFGIKYTGCNYLTSAIAMDKGIAKHIIKACGVPTPNGFVVKKSRRNENYDYPYPCVVKPASGGSSIGMSYVDGPDQLEAALDAAFVWGDEVMVEETIFGREFSVGILDGKALPVIEIAPVAGKYDYKNKYTAGAAVETCPADLDQETTERMQKYAQMVAEAIGINAYSRLDFLLNSKDNTPYCLEVNTLSGMTPTSLLPQEAAAAGLSYEQLCEEIIRLSLAKYN